MKYFIDKKSDIFLMSIYKRVIANKTGIGRKIIEEEFITYLKNFKEYIAWKNKP